MCRAGRGSGSVDKASDSQWTNAIPNLEWRIFLLLQYLLKTSGVTDKWFVRVAIEWRGPGRLKQRFISLRRSATSCKQEPYKEFNCFVSSSSASLKILFEKWCDRDLIVSKTRRMTARWVSQSCRSSLFSNIRGNNTSNYHVCLIEPTVLTASCHRL